MLISPAHARRIPSRILVLLLCSACCQALTGQESEPGLFQRLQQSQIPKHETGVLEFLQQHPTFDGRDVIIAIFDTGVDPEAPGMQLTTTGERKLLNIYDASGAGDVNTRTVVKGAQGGGLTGLSGRNLTLPDNIQNPDGTFHLGLKHGKELFRAPVWRRLMQHRSEQMHQHAAQGRAAFLRSQSPSDSQQTTGPSALETNALTSEFEHYLTSLDELDKGPFYDCVLWNDGQQWNVIIDTDEDGDLRDEKILRPFGVAGEWAQFPEPIAMNFGVQVFESGKRLSIVTTSGSHGTHVASIAAAHHPDNPALGGIAPGAKILSIRMGDVRTGGSSTYMGESLAVAIAAQYKVDIMNASWGGQSYYQDASSWGVKLYDLLARKYGVTAFVSAGNDGPALSTVGSPGGEAPHVVGVGAYVSPEMGKLLYSVVGETPSTPFMFSARGPARNGDIGVDILAPGAAIASLARDSLESNSLYAGTSMAAPSAAGVGALLISAAKQEGLRTSPARLRYALMNTARTLATESPFAQGAGLIETSAAWNHLKAFQSIDALDLFFEVDVAGNTYTNGPGLYLRDDNSAFTGRRSIRVNVQPIFPESDNSDAQYALNLFLQTLPNPDWLKVPDGMHLANGGKVFRPEIDFDQLPQNHGPTGSVHHHQIGLVLADSVQAGPLVRIPLTLVQSTPVPAGRSLTTSDFQLDSSTSFTQFLTPPPGVNHLSLKVDRATEAGVNKLFILHALTLVANDEIDAFENRRYFTLKPGATETFEIPVIAGKPLELTLHQVWSYTEPTLLSWEGTWRSMIVDRSPLLIHDDARPSKVSLESAFDSKLSLNASIHTAVLSYLPESTQIFPFDRRGTFPKGAKDAAEQPSFELEQIIHMQLDSPIDVQFQYVEFATEFEVGGGVISIYDAKGFPIGTDLAPSNPDKKLALPEGKNKLVRRFISPDMEALKRLEKLPFVIEVPVEPQSPNISEGLEAFSVGKTTDTLTFSQGRREWVVLQMQEALKTEKLPKRADHFRGTLRIKEAETEIGTIELIALSVQEPSSKPTPTTTASPASTSELETAIYEQQLAFLRNSRNDPSDAVQRERRDLIKALARDSTDPRLWLEQIYALAIEARLIDPWFLGSEPTPLHEIRPHADPRSLQRRIERMIQDCKPAKVAEYLGARPVIENPESKEGKAEAERLKQFLNLSKYLKEAYLIAAHVHLLTGQIEQSRRAFNESRRWNQGDSAELTDLASRMEVQLLWREGYPARALEAVRTLRSAKPNDALLLQWQTAIREELGWTLATEWTTLYEQLSTSHLKSR